MKASRASTEYLADFVRALAGSRAFLAKPVSIRIQSRPYQGAPPVSIVVPVGTLRKDIERRMPLAAVARDPPSGRRRPGWKGEFIRSVQAAAELPPLREEQILGAVRAYRRSRSRRDVTVASGSQRSVASNRRGEWDGLRRRLAGSRALYSCGPATAGPTTSSRSGAEHGRHP